MLPTSHRVTAVRTDVEGDLARGAPRVATLHLEPLDAELDAPRPGQFHMAWVPAVGEVPISVSGFADGTVELTIAAVGATTEALCAAGVGSTLGLRGPFGQGWSPPDPTRPVVVVAGGLGLAPLRMLIHAELAARADPASAPMTVVVGARSPAEVLFAAELGGLSERIDVAITVDRAGSGWRGGIGLVTEPLRRVEVGVGAAARICGPEVMMRVSAQGLVDAGVEPAHVEVSMERSMACAIAHCGRCQIGPVMLCRDGPVLSWAEASALMEVRRW